MNAGGVDSRGVAAPPAPDIARSKAARAYGLPAELDVCVGRHPRPMKLGEEGLQWVLAQPPLETARDVEHTCARCQKVSYELLRIGGAFVIRRTERKRVHAVVHETARVRKALAEEWWRTLVYGTGP